MRKPQETSADPESVPVETLPRDLIPPPTDPWIGLEVPGGWEPVADICRRAYAGRHALADRIARRIWREVPATRKAMMPSVDARESIVRNVEMILLTLAQNRGPLPEELAILREAGHRRAEQGLTAEAVIQHYHIGFRELWDALTGAARGEPPATMALLLDGVTTVLQWIHDVTTAVSEAHEETTRAQEATANVLRQRFLHRLESGDLDAYEPSRLAHSLGFDPDGSFQAMCISLDDRDDLVEPIRSEVRRVIGSCQLFLRGRDVVVLSQGVAVSVLEAAVRKPFPDATIGIGLERNGLAGARASIGDAERAVNIAPPSGTSSFERHWLEASLLHSSERLRDVLSSGPEIARKHPDLAMTVRIFAASGFSLAETARKLHVHANTVTYRLDRWQLLTGWDPRSFEGLAKSIVSLTVQSPLTSPPS